MESRGQQPKYYSHLADALVVVLKLSTDFDQRQTLKQLVEAFDGAVADVRAKIDRQLMGGADG